MKVAQFKSLVMAHIQDITEITMVNLNNTGDTEGTCQQLCIINALKHLNACVSGVEQSDINSNHEPLINLGLPTIIYEILMKEGYTTIRDVMSLSDSDLRSLDGIAYTRLSDIRKALLVYNRK
jgi:DNA-directed RNA polymerase alpha subunit